jgi:hypothetical protein
MDIILLTSVVVTLFLVFIIASYRELKNITKENYIPSKETGPRADMINFVGRLFDNETASKKMTYKQKDLIYKAVNRTISDMENDGVYFSEAIKDELKKQREELNCEYSGLPSVKSYDVNNEEV